MSTRRRQPWSFRSASSQKKSRVRKAPNGLCFMLGWESPFGNRSEALSEEHSQSNSFLWKWRTRLAMYRSCSTQARRRSFAELSSIQMPSFWYTRYLPFFLSTDLEERLVDDLDSVPVLLDELRRDGFSIGQSVH